MTARAAVLVVTWNSAQDVTSCLDAVLASEDVSLDVVVVDNASTDGTRDLLQPYADDVDLVMSAENTGYAGGNLAALERTTSDLVVLLNPDCVVEPGTIAQLLGHLEAHPRCGAVSALLLDPDGSPQYFARREPTFLRSIAWFLGTANRWDLRLHGKLRDEREYRRLLRDPPDQAFEVDVPAAACVALRRAAWSSQLFDERYPLFFNDVDLYRRLRRDGWSVEVLPTARALHGHGRSHRQLATDAKRAEQLLSLRRYARDSWPTPLPGLFDLLLRLDAWACDRRARRSPDAEYLRALARGSRGALGLPGGATPWLSRHS